MPAKKKVPPQLRKWNATVKSVRKAHPKYTFKQALKAAKKKYKSGK